MSAEPAPSAVLSTAATMLRRLRTFTQTVALPKAWRFVPTTSMVRRCSNPSGSLAALQNQFTSWDLIRVGVATRDTTGQLVPSRVLTGRLFFPYANSPLDAIENDHGRILGTCPSVCHLGRQRLAQRAARNFLLTATDEDAHVLTANKFCVLPASSLLKLSWDQFHEIVSPAGAKNRGSRYRFVIVAWHVTKINAQPPDSIVSVLKRLHRLNVMQPLSFDPTIRVWAPAPIELERIQIAVELRDRQRVQKLLLTSATDSTTSLTTYKNNVARQRPASFATAYRGLVEANRLAKKTGVVAPVAQALDKFARAYEGPLGASIDAAVRDSRSPVRQALTTSLFGLVPRGFEILPEVRLARRIATGDIHAEIEAPSELDLRQLGQHIDYLLKLEKSGIGT